MTNLDVLNNSVITLTCDDIIYHLSPITQEELLKVRLSKIPGVVYKRNDNLYFSEISDETNICGLRHMCRNDCSHICNCARTKDLTPSFQKENGKSFPKSILDAWRIEKYDFINEGIETFNMKNNNDSFLVFSCNKFMYNDRKADTSLDKKNTILNIASLYIGFDGSYPELKLRIKNNINK